MRKAKRKSFTKLKKKKKVKKVGHWGMGVGW